VSEEKKPGPPLDEDAQAILARRRKLLAGAAALTGALALASCEVRKEEREPTGGAPTAPIQSSAPTSPPASPVPQSASATSMPASAPVVTTPVPTPPLHPCLKPPPPRVKKKCLSYRPTPRICLKYMPDDDKKI
jgi:hypothetical protein